MEFRRAYWDERPTAASSRATSGRSSRCSTGARLFAEVARLPALRLRDRRRATSTRTSSPTRTGPAASARWSSTTTGSPRPRAGSATRRLRREGRDGSKQLVRRSLAEGLGLPTDPGAFVVFRDARTGLESPALLPRDLGARAGGPARGVRAITSSGSSARSRDGIAGQWARLAARLGRGRRAVPRRGDARAPARAGPRPAPLGLRRGPVGAVLARDGQRGPAGRAGATHRDVPGGHRRGDRCPGDPAGCRGGDAGADGAAFRGRAGRSDRQRTGTAARLADLSRIGEPRPGADVAATSLAWFDELRLAGSRRPGSARRGFDEARGVGDRDLIRGLLALPRPSAHRRPGAHGRRRLLEPWLGPRGRPDAMGVNTWEGVEYARPRTASWRSWRWAGRLDAIEAGLPAAPGEDRAPSGAPARAPPRRPGTGWTRLAARYAPRVAAAPAAQRGRPAPSDQAPPAPKRKPRSSAARAGQPSRIPQRARSAATRGR